MRLPQLPTKEQVRYHGERWVWVPGLAVLAFLVFPSSSIDLAPLLQAGKVANRDVIAPFTFSVNKTDQELAREAEELASTVKPIYAFEQRALDSATSAMHVFFAQLDAAAGQGAGGIVRAAHDLDIALTSQEASYLANGKKRHNVEVALADLFDHTLALGVVGPGVLQVEQAPDVIVRRGSSETDLTREQVLSYARYLARARLMHPDKGSAAGDAVYVRLAGHFFRPTLVPDTGETDRRRDELRRSVDPTKYVVRAGERIVGAHEVVTSEAQERLAALQQELLRRGSATSRAGLGAIGPILRDSLVLGIFWVLLLFYRRETYRDQRQVALVGCLFAAALLGGAAIARWAPEHPVLIPLPFAAMMLTVLFNGRVSLIGAMILSVVIGLQPVFHDSPALFFCVVGGVAAALSVRVLRRRSHLMVVVSMVGAGYLAGAVAIGLVGGWSVGETLERALLGMANGLVSAGLTLLLLPAAESLTHITTDLTLLELSDPSRPLLRRLSLEAPGTYAHSIAMANLVEAACERVGANGLLGRVGCYYHDVGKVKNPQYFVENQTRGNNPHDRLDAHRSAEIIKAHVIDGLALAAEAHLPDVVAAFIPEHHGTSEITYFLDRAKKSAAGAVPQTADYTYPGPKPRSIETAVTMLADSVEASLRVLEDLTPEKIAEAINHIVRTKLNQGQLDDAPITLQQISLVKDQFVRSITGMYHNRIDYPESSGGISATWQPAAHA
jgi:putative nucleotidyltransferase with HDIG domain